MNSIGMTHPTSSKPSSLRTPTQLRVSSLIGYALSLLAAIIVAYFMHLLFAREGRGGFRDLNPGGILETLAFVLTFSYALLGARRILRIPVTSLLSAGLIVPKTTASVAMALKTHDNPAGFEFGGGLSILRDRGRIIGVSDARGELTAWDRVLRVDSNVAVTELRELLSNAQYVVVASGDDVQGVITQEMYLAGV
jgi:hypothetical protein